MHSKFTTIEALHRDCRNHRQIVLRDYWPRLPTEESPIDGGLVALPETPPWPATERPVPLRPAPKTTLKPAPGLGRLTISRYSCILRSGRLADGYR